MGSAGLALQAAHEASDDLDGVGPLLGTVEAGQIPLQKADQMVLAVPDLLWGQDGIRQKGWSLGVFQE